MNERLLRLEDELDQVKAWRDDLTRRLKEPQGDISDEEWVIMLHKKHAYEKYYSCVLAQYKELKREIDDEVN